MPDLALTGITLKEAMTLLILAAAIYSFISEKLSPDVTALLAIIALLLTGVLTPAEAFAGFSHPATISVAAMLVLSAGIERTGALSFLARRLFRPIGHSELSLTVAIVLVIGGISAFINNTAAVAIFIPVVLEKQETFKSDEKYLAELLIKPGSSWIGREINRENFERDHDLELLGLARAGRHLNPDEPFPPLEARDSLRVRGALNQVMALAAQEALELHRPEESGKEGLNTEGDASAEEKFLAEVVVLTPSGLIGQTLKEARFAERFKAVALALRRRGAATGRPSTTPLRIGDALVVEGDKESLKALDEAPGFLVIGTPDVSVPRAGKLIVTLLTLVAVVTLVSFGVIPIVIAGAAGCAVLMLTGCLRPREAYQTSLMIYGPGGYRFRDFIRMGIVLDLLVATLALWLIPKFWPLTAP